MEDLNIEDLKLIMGDEARDLPQFAHFSWCTTRVEEDCQISPAEVDMIYEGLVVPEGKTTEAYLKFFYCLVEYIRSIKPYEEWIKVEESGENWMEYIAQAGEYVAKYEEDQEKWISDFKEKMRGNPDTFTETDNSL